MKTTTGLRATLAALCAFVITMFSVFGPSRAGATETGVTPWTLISTSDDYEVSVLMHSLPRENEANPATQSSTFAASRNNFIDQVVLGGQQSAGSGFEMARRLSAIQSNLAVTSSAFQSWQANVHSGATNQFGGRIHVAVVIIMKHGTFLPRDLTIRLQSHARNAAGTAWVIDGVANSTAVFTGPLNANRLRLDSAGVDGVVGDVRSADQSNTAPTTRFFFVGNGFAAAASGTGTQQEQLDRSRTYIEMRNMVVECTVSFPYAVGESSRLATAKTVLLNSMLQQPELAESGELNLPSGYVTPERVTLGEAEEHKTNIGTLYLMQRSTDLTGWSGANTVALFGNDDRLLYPTPFLPNSTRGFARIVTTAPQVLATAQGQQVPRGTPVATEVPLGDNVTP